MPKAHLFESVGKRAPSLWPFRLATGVVALAVTTVAIAWGAKAGHLEEVLWVLVRAVLPN